MTWGRTSGTYKENGRVPAAFIKQQMKRGDSPVSFIFKTINTAALSCFRAYKRVYGGRHRQP